MPTAVTKTAPKSTIRAFARTDVGRVRKENEDSYLSDPRAGLFLVADGMGGHAGGEVASKLAVDAIDRRMKAPLYQTQHRLSGMNVGLHLANAIEHANLTIRAVGKRTPALKGMGTTLVALVIHHGQAVIAHLGDSRVYHIDEFGTHPLTEDHGIAGTNIVTRALGITATAEPDLYFHPTELVPGRGEAFVLASDGLTGYLESPDELGLMVKKYGDRAPKKLIELANARGGHDNITVIVVFP